MNQLNKVLNAFVYRVASEIANEAQERVPVVTRNLRNDIKVYEEGDLRASVGNSKLASYAKYVHNGTGLYGPHKTRIVPKKKKALAFTYKGKKVVCKSVKGQRAQPYLEEGAKDYLEGGGFDAAVADLGGDIGKTLAGMIEKQLKSAV